MKIRKDLNNLEIANLLRSVSAAYEIKDKNKNKFKIIAYDRAADAVEHLSSEAKDLWEENKLIEVAGVGESISHYLGEIFSKGHCDHFEKLFTGIKPAVFELIKISGIGPKTAYTLASKLKISDKGPVDDFQRKLKKGEVAEIEGFGEDSQNAFLRSVQEFKNKKRRLLINYSEKLSISLIDWLKSCDSVIKADVLGSLRRKVSTIGDIDIAVATTDPKLVLQHFTNYPKTKRVKEIGEKTASIMLPGEIQVDLIVQDEDSYGSLLQHFTGSKHHNIALREYANNLKPKLSLSEHGIKKKDKGRKQDIVKFKSEKEFYRYLGLDWIPPELRENTGEIEAARKQNIPILVEVADIKADLQIHSNFNIETSHDLGETSMEEIIETSKTMNYEYIAFTEHNPSRSGHTDRQIFNLLMKKKRKIEQLNSSCSSGDNNRTIYVFNSLEIDILPDGNLPVDEKSLDLLDFALVSIHSSFNQSREKMTKRIIKALEHPKVKIFAHPTGRKLGYRESVEINWDDVFNYCKANDKWLEINADPMRMDLPDYLVKEAIDNGIKLTLGTDAHSKGAMHNIKYGVYVARRGWAAKDDIINTCTYDEFIKMLE